MNAVPINQSCLPESWLSSDGGNIDLSHVGFSRDVAEQRDFEGHAPASLVEGDPIARVGVLEWPDQPIAIPESVMREPVLR
jgi:hypothetical protein